MLEDAQHHRITHDGIRVESQSGVKPPQSKGCRYVRTAFLPIRLATLLITPPGRERAMPGVALRERQCNAARNDDR